MDARGQNPGQPDWGAYVASLVDTCGSLAAVAERMASHRRHTEDVESIARALRRLRDRGSLSGGKWGERLLQTFGLGSSIEARLRFMGSYHSRFVDLPVSLGLDLVQAWDRPPQSESPLGRRWLSLARAVLASRRGDHALAAQHLATARAAHDDVWGSVEVALGEAVLATRDAPTVLPPGLLAAEAPIATLHGPDASCLRARWVGQVAWVHNRRGDYAVGEALHRALPDGPEVHPFARSRRANGLAFALHRLRRDHEALELARLAARHAGDAGHVRLRAMALLMIARVAPDTTEGREARQRAAWIGAMLEDDVLVERARRSAGRAAVEDA